MTTLPPTQEYTGAFNPPSAAETPTSGGTFLAISNAFAHAASYTNTVIRMRGRALAKSRYVGH